MTDVIRPANGQATNAQSSGNAWRNTQETSGYGAAIRERTLVAPESGEARAWPKRPGPGAESPAGWFLSADGEAAPPFRPGMEPARSDEKAEHRGADGADQNGGWHRHSPPISLYPLRARWPWSLQAVSRYVPVVGPTEALRGRGGGQGTAVPPGAVPGLPHPAKRSSWQLAQEVWQESGVTWELNPPEITDAESASGQYQADGPFNFERPAYEPQAAEPATFEPRYSEPPQPEPATADARLADPEPADPEPAVAGPVGAGPAEGGGPYFADSGVVPQESESLSRRPPRQADAPPARDPWAAAERRAVPDDATRREPARQNRRQDSTRQDLTGEDQARQEFMRRDPTGDDAVRPPARPNHRGQNPTRPEPIGADLARDDAMRLDLRENPGCPGAGQPRRSERPGPTWSEYPASGSPGQDWPVGCGRVPLGAPVTLDPQAPESVGLPGAFNPAGPDGPTAPGYGGGALPLSEPDELFRAWQGSVNEAAAGRRPWSVPRRGAPGSRRRRALQVAAFGVPVAVIVTVGAGALMMLTGRANDMLAVRADTGAPSSAATTKGSTGTNAAARPAAGGVPPAFVSAALSGYPGQHGVVTVASMMAAAGVTLAVGTADGHPAIWRRAPNGSWTLESATSVGKVAGSAGLTSVALGPAGWIAVGTASVGKATGPVVLASVDGLRWQPVTPLAAAAGAGTEFLGVAAGRAGYVVVGRQMIGGRAFAALWYSADLRSWTADDNGGLDGRLASSTANAVVATAGGFIAVGSHGADQSLWTSSDGRQWRLGYVPAPAGADSATLRSVAASGSRVVAAGYAATPDGDIPVVVASTDGGGHWRQIVLQAPAGLGVITALTAAPRGFVAAGVVGRSGSRHAVTWVSPDGLTWSRPVQAAGSEVTALTATGTTVTGTSEQGTTPTVVALPAP